jgi:hypothetical protein
MTKVAIALLTSVTVSALAIAQDRSTQTAAINMKDPRVGLKAGLHDAGVAVRNLE